MIYALLFIAFVFVVAFFQVKSNRKRLVNRLSDISVFNVEAPNRIRIYNDSMRILETTKNAKTFIGRVQDVIEFQDWAAVQVLNGMPLKMNGNILSVRKGCNEFINRNAFRVALAEFTLFSKVDRVRGKKIDRAAIRAFEAIDGLSACLKTADNQGEIKSELENLRNLVEDIYSNIQ